MAFAAAAAPGTACVGHGAKILESDLGFETELNGVSCGSCLIGKLWAGA